MSTSRLYAWIFEALKKGGDRMLRSLHMRLAREEGQALVEYALIVSLIAVIGIAALASTGQSISGIIDFVGNSV